MTAKMLLFAVFCCVSGGPLGMEAVVQKAGPLLALVLLLIIPLVWALPDALITAELSTMIPEEGGYYQWVKQSLGPCAGFLNGWWTWIYAVLDGAMYPVYFGEVAMRVIALWLHRPELAESTDGKWLSGALMVIAFTLVNLRGARDTGKASSVLSWLVIAPFALMMVWALLRIGQAHPITWSRPHEGVLKALSGSLGLAIWNYLGWDSLSTVAEEVEDPGKAYPFAMFTGIPLVTVLYIGAMLAGLAFQPDLSVWSDGSWPDIARSVGGEFLFGFMLLGAIAGNAGLFTASFLAISRVPWAMAQDGYLPAMLTRQHPRYGTPTVVILGSAVIYIGLARVFSFGELASINVIFYAVALTMEGLALLWYRRHQPDRARPYRIPGGLGVAGLVVLLPVLVLTTVIGVSWAQDGWRALLLPACGLLSGPLAWWGFSARAKTRASHSS